MRLRPGGYDQVEGIDPDPEVVDVCDTILTNLDLLTEYLKAKQVADDLAARCNWPVGVIQPDTEAQ